MRLALVWIAQIPVVVGLLVIWPAIDWVGLSPPFSVAILCMAVLIASVSFVVGRRVAWTVPSVALAAMVLLAIVFDLSPVQPAVSGRSQREAAAGV